MPTLTIDNKPITVDPGATILDAAEALGIKIPTLCFLKGHCAATSCMVCVVKIKGMAKFVPACATKVQEGMEVESESNEVRHARKMALELLIGDHLGDCIGPCQGACPAHMDIPLMIQHIAAGRHREAIQVIKERIALPAILGRICPEICEKVCRRSIQDSAISICLLKRFAADVDLASGSPYFPECKPPTGKRAAIIGSGPTGLSAAYYLLREGIHCTIFDEHSEPGGALRQDVPADRLPREVLDAEIDLIRKLGAEFKSNTKIGPSTSIQDLRHEYDAVLIAVGKIDATQAQSLGLEMAINGVKVDKHTMMTAAPGIFAAGSAVVPSKFAVRAVAEGRSAAKAITQYLAEKPIVAHDRPYTVRLGRVTEEEMSVFMTYASASGRVIPESENLTPSEANREAERCLHCECSKLDNCRLRDHAAEYEANPSLFKGEWRKVERNDTHPDIIHEPGKCISCGICVQIAEEHREPLGLTFIGRGFRVELGVPFNEPLSKGLRKAAIECAKACPTGALTVRENQ